MRTAANVAKVGNSHFLLLLIKFVCLVKIVVLITVSPSYRSDYDCNRSRQGKDGVMREAEKRRGKEGEGKGRKKNYHPVDRMKPCVYLG